MPELSEPGGILTGSIDLRVLQSARRADAINTDPAHDHPSPSRGERMAKENVTHPPQAQLPNNSVTLFGSRTGDFQTNNAVEPRPQAKANTRLRGEGAESMEKQPRPRGTGSVYSIKGSRVWWIKYYRNGVPIRESSGSNKVKAAEKLLRLRIGAISSGTYIPLQVVKTLVSELAEDLVREYRTNGRKSIDDLEARWKLHLEPFFGHLRAIEVSTQLVTSYVDHRQQEGAENATINRELAALKRMFSLARQSTPPKINAAPYIAMLKESNVRTGFLENRQHDKLAAECAKIGLWMRAIFEVGVTFGWRHEELLALRVSHINLLVGTIRLEPGTTKNDQGREVSMTLPVKALLSQCVHGKTSDDYVFTRDDGKPVRDFRGAWDAACEAAKVPGLLFHDLRRTAARNLRRAGVAEGVIMKIGGWKTRSVFERYAIVSQTDIRDAMTSLQAKQQSDNAEAAAQQKSAASEEKEFGQSSDTIGPNMPENGATEQRRSGAVVLPN
jgi:integrase